MLKVQRFKEENKENLHTHELTHTNWDWEKKPTNINIIKTTKTWLSNINAVSDASPLPTHIQVEIREEGVGICKHQMLDKCMANRSFYFLEMCLRKLLMSIRATATIGKIATIAIFLLFPFSLSYYKFRLSIYFPVGPGMAILMKQQQEPTRKTKKSIYVTKYNGNSTH